MRPEIYINAGHRGILVIMDPHDLDNLRRLVRDWWRTTLDLVAEAKKATSS